MWLLLYVVYLNVIIIMCNIFEYNIFIYIYIYLYIYT